MDFAANQIIFTPKKRLQFHIVREVQELSKIMPDLPENEVYKMISCGGFSSIAFVKYIADKTRIKREAYWYIKRSKFRKRFIAYWIETSPNKYAKE